MGGDMRHNAQAIMQARLEAKTRELRKAKDDARRFKRLNRERSDIIKTMRALNLNINYMT